MIQRAFTSAKPAAPATLSVPRHVAIIMDGNRRWAHDRGLSASEGHRAGAATLREIVRTAGRAGVAVLTVYAFSEENWRRDEGEVSTLMELIRSEALDELADLARDNVRVRTIGRIDRLPAATRAALEALVAATASNDGLVLALAVNYGARAELCDAIRAIARDVAAGTLAPDAIDDDRFASYLSTADLPDPDLLIRTGGELRVSNFLLYQIAYTELWSTRAHWPDFDETLFSEALRSFSTRQRRFGS